MYRMSAEGRKALTFFEGARTTAYKDTAGHLTIGVGHLLTETELQSGLITCLNTAWHDGISETEIDLLLAEDIKRFEVGIAKQINARLFQHEFDALCSWCFNLGLGQLKSSTLLKVILQGKYENVPIELRKWTRSGGQVTKGLVKRREAECHIWSTGQYDIQKFFV